MKATLQREDVYTLTVNGRAFPGLRVMSKWEGCLKLEDSKGRVLIIAGDQRGGGFIELFADIFGEGKDLPQDVAILKASPDLIAEFPLTPAKAAA